jgi:molecular chaperone DnaK
MTVVAKGAALFASTISVSDEVKETTRDKTKLQLDIKYEATTVELDEMVNLKVLKEKTTGTFPEKIYADVVRFDGAWSSGKKLIGEKATIVDVLLVEGRSNSFEINVYDEAGNKLECQPHQFSILQGIGGLDKMQVLPYYIGIGKFFSSEGKDLFQPAKGLGKNKTVPATGVINGLKTRSEIRPGMIKDIIRIPIYQGDYNAEGTNPVLNNLVTEVIITGEDMPALLPLGSDLDITIKVDSSQLMKFTAYFPLLNHTEELEIEIKQTEPPTEELLSKEISKAKRTAQKVNANDVSENIEALEEQLENEKGSADGKMKILDGLRKELLKLDSAEKVAEWPKVEQELKDAFYELEDLIEKIKANSDDDDLNIDKVQAHNAESKKTIEHIIQNKDTKAAKELTDEIIGLSIELRNAVTGGDVDRRRLEYHDREFNNLQWKDKNKARQLVNHGLKLISDGKTSQLKPLLHQIWDLRIDPDGDRDTLG